MNDFWTAFSALLAALLGLVGAYEVGVKVGSFRTRKALSNERDLQSLAEIYAPLFGLFTTVHVTTRSTTGAKYLRQRLRNAAKLLREDWSPVEALKAIFDKQILRVSGEVEYGGSFPLNKITKHLNGKEHLADRELLLLVERANRSRYESKTEHNELTDEDFRLLQHISTRHAALAKRLGQA